MSKTKPPSLCLSSERILDYDYLYASNTNVSSFVSVKLSGSCNYLLWKAQILCLLDSKNMCGIVDSTFAGPRDSGTGITRQYDSLVRGWIFGSVTEDVLADVFNLGSAKAVWEKLKSIHDPTVCFQEVEHTKNMEWSILPVKFPDNLWDEIDKLDPDTTHPCNTMPKLYCQRLVKIEQSMRNIAESFSITAALMTTILFATGVMVSDSSNKVLEMLTSEVKTPLFIFVISNAISLFASNTALVVFLSILASGFAEKDSLLGLPRRLFIGLCSFFLCIAAMMVALGASLFLVFCDQNPWKLVLIRGLLFVAIAFFVVVQFPFMVNLFTSTYLHIFRKQRKTHVLRDFKSSGYLHEVNIKQHCSEVESMLKKEQELALVATNSNNMCGIMNSTVVASLTSAKETMRQYNNHVFNLGSAKAVLEKLKPTNDPTLCLQKVGYMMKKEWSIVPMRLLDTLCDELDVLKHKKNEIVKEILFRSQEETQRTQNCGCTEDGFYILKNTQNSSDVQVQEVEAQGSSLSDTEHSKHDTANAYVPIRRPACGLLAMTSPLLQSDCVTEDVTAEIFNPGSAKAVWGNPTLCLQNVGYIKNKEWLIFSMRLPDNLSDEIEMTELEKIAKDEEDNKGKKPIYNPTLSLQKELETKKEDIQKSENGIEQQKKLLEVTAKMNSSEVESILQVEEELTYMGETTYIQHSEIKTAEIETKEVFEAISILTCILEGCYDLISNDQCGCGTVGKIRSQNYYNSHKSVLLVDSSYEVVAATIEPFEVKSHHNSAMFLRPLSLEDRVGKIHTRLESQNIRTLRNFLEMCQGLLEGEMNFLGKFGNPNIVKLDGYCWEDRETNEIVAMKNIMNAYDNYIDAERTLRELKVLRLVDDENTKVLLEDKFRVMLVKRRLKTVWVTLKSICDPITFLQEVESDTEYEDTQNSVKKIEQKKKLPEVTVNEDWSQVESILQKEEELDLSGNKKCIATIVGNNHVTKLSVFQPHAIYCDTWAAIAAQLLGRKQNEIKNLGKPNLFVFGSSIFADSHFSQPLKPPQSISNCRLGFGRQIAEQGTLDDHSVNLKLLGPQEVPELETKKEDIQKSENGIEQQKKLLEVTAKMTSSEVESILQVEQELTYMGETTYIRHSEIKTTEIGTEEIFEAIALLTYIRVDEVKGKLKMVSSEVLSIGICEIGKTTLAKAVHKDIRNKFEKCSLIENIKDISKQNDSTNLCKLQQKLLDDFLNEKSIRVQSVIHGQTLLGTKLRGFKVQNAKASLIGNSGKMNFLGKIGHPTLVKLVGYCWEDREFLLEYESIQKGSLENHRLKNVLKVLMEIHSDLLMNFDQNNITPLHKASEQGHTKVMKCLLEKNSCMANIAMSNPKTGLHLCARQGHFKMLKALSQKVPRIVTRADKKGQTALHVVVKGQNVDVVDALIEVGNGLISMIDKKENIALHITTRHGRIEELPSSYKGIINKEVINKYSEIPLDKAEKFNRSGIAINQQHGVTTRKLKQTVSDIKHGVHDNAINSTTVIAVLIAAVTFTAIFQLPSKYVDKSKQILNGFSLDEGSIAANPEFIVFLFFDALALFISLAVVVVQMSTMMVEKRAKKQVMVVINKLMWLACVFVSVAFLALSFVVDGNEKWLAVG